MRLHELVTFAQNEISPGELRERWEPLPTPEEPIVVEGDYGPRVPAEGDYDLPTIEAERLPIPDWLKNPQNEIVPIGGANSTIFPEGDFDRLITPIARVAGQVPDVLAYYRPFHFYREGHWGIYLKASGILDVAAHLKGTPVTRGTDAAIVAAHMLLFEHELFHCFTELAATRAEVVARLPIYPSYFRDRFANANEEAMANAYAHSKTRKRYPTFIKAAEDWMKSQPEGYRHFERYAGRRLPRGRLVCSQHIIRFAPPPATLRRPLPSDFLFGNFGKAVSANVPSYLVVDAAIADYVLRPFPKGNGVRVWVHTRGEHPPPHIHVEIPLGNTERRRCVWPSLQQGSPDWHWPLAPYKGDQPLKTKEYAKQYLREHGDEILAKLKSIYPGWQLSRQRLEDIPTYVRR
jgi:hypothetical protein